MDSDTLLGVIIGTIVAVCFIIVVAFTAIYTHESHLRQIRYDKTVLVTCLQTHHTPQECRAMVHGQP